MTSSDTTELVRDIRRLARDSFNLSHSFEDTKEKIFEVVGLVEHVKEIPASDYARAKALGEEWSNHVKLYTTLVWDSRRVAGHAEAAINDFTQGVMTFIRSEDVGFEDKCAELQNCTEQLENDEKRAAGMSQRFSDLKGGVKSTSTAWRSLAEGFKRALELKDQSLGEKISNLDVTLKNFNEKIEEQTERVEELRNTPGGSGILRFLSPFYWFRRLGNWVEKLQAESELAESTEERDEINRQLQAAVKERDEYREKYELLCTNLSQIDSGFENIIEKLVIFGRIWAALRADLQTIQLKLERAGTSRTSVMMKIRLQGTEELYKHLGEALREYQLCVNEEDLRDD